MSSSATVVHGSLVQCRPSGDAYAALEQIIFHRWLSGTPIVLSRNTEMPESSTRMLFAVEPFLLKVQYSPSGDYLVQWSASVALVGDL